MAVLDIIGTDGMTRTSHNEHWSRRNGPGFREVWKGPPDRAQTFYETYINSSQIDDVDLDIDGGVGVVTITTSEATINGGTVNTEELNVIWEMTGNDLYKDIMQHQTFSKYIVGGAAIAQKELQQVIIEFEKGNIEFTPAAGVPTLLRDIRQTGQTQYVRSVPILRKTIQVSSRSVTASSWLGVDRAHTLKGNQGEAEDTWYGPNPPTELIGRIDQMAEADDAKKQWLKRAPQTRQVGRHDFSEIQEWWFAKAWSETFYGGTNEDGNP